ncbi:hypothetical protein M422DRAFT_781028 [Sphaerobolus stellatus SS14]|uniref:NmrA-like domain-containing protein n=1 Tax=Sphaerobolus stellatus (strain SS14) TaxID=990650 RepID=A0A0C9UX72_SPHS4|nr:hypothetical protein M422DRAFT_781028 [Sphaerobolus stellatus SS14]
MSSEEQQTVEQSRKTVLITGSTGKQGHAVISALLSSSTPLHILALTRNPASPAARELVSKAANNENVKVSAVKGDMDDPSSIREIFEAAKKDGGIWGVFAVFAFPGLGANADGEERQGLALADVSYEFGVESYVLSTVERGGEGNDDNYTLDRAAKVKIERHVRSLGEKGFKWTILRPAFFMENFDGTLGKITAAVLRTGLQKETKIQLINTDDIGHVAAAIFKNPEPHIHTIVVVTGDVLTMSEMDASHNRVTGKPMPSVPAFLASALISMNSHTKGLISDMERVHRDRSSLEGGHEAVLKDIRAIYPNMTTFEEWVRKKSTGTVKTERKKGWNNLSIGSLVKGKN